MSSSIYKIVVLGEGTSGSRQVVSGRPPSRSNTYGMRLTTSKRKPSMQATSRKKSPWTTNRASNSQSGYSSRHSGHCRAIVIQLRGAHLLPRSRRSHRLLRHHLHLKLHQGQKVDHRARGERPQGHRPLPGRQQGRSLDLQKRPQRRSREVRQAVRS
jgi:hypothetical protein